MTPHLKMFIGSLLIAIEERQPDLMLGGEALVVGS